MRVISGKARGIELKGPKGLRCRPTLGKVREALFSILGPEVPGSRILDGFAGTGALGIEALSRGAESAVFVEKHRPTAMCLRENLLRCRFTGLGDNGVPVAEVLGGDVRRWIQTFVKEARQFDIIFLDPPYGCAELEEVAVLCLSLLAPGGTLVIEQATRLPVPSVGGCLPFRTVRYGDTSLAFFTQDPPQATVGDSPGGSLSFGDEAL